MNDSYTSSKIRSYTKSFSMNIQPGVFTLAASIFEQLIRFFA